MSSSMKGLACLLLVAGACKKHESPATQIPTQTPTPTPTSIPNPTTRASAEPGPVAFDFEATLQRLLAADERSQRAALAELEQRWPAIRADVAKLAQRNSVPERAAGAYLLERLAYASDAEAARANLRDAEEQIRLMATRTVTRLRDAASVPILSENAAKAKYEECRAILEALRQFAPGSVERVCADLARSEDWAKRRVAAQSLGQVQAPASPDLLVSLVGDPVWVVRLDAIQAVGSRRLAAARPRLIAGLHDQDPKFRAAIAKALGEIADREDATVVAGLAISDQDVMVRREAAETLARFGEALALPALEKILAFADEVAKVRRAAASSACTFHGERARRLQKNLLTDSDPTIRSEAKLALEALEDSPGASPPGPTRTGSPTGR